MFGVRWLVFEWSSGYNNNRGSLECRRWSWEGLRAGLEGRMGLSHGAAESPRISREYTIYNNQQRTTRFRDAETAAEHAFNIFLCNAIHVPGRKTMLTFNA